MHLNLPLPGEPIWAYGQQLLMLVRILAFKHVLQLSMDQQRAWENPAVWNPDFRKKQDSESFCPMQTSSIRGCPSLVEVPNLSVIKNSSSSFAPQPQFKTTTA
jgi:hypothetical protein